MCPKSCIVEIIREAEGFEISGFKCDRGREYALRELINPTRILTTTVKTDFKDFPRLPVKTDKEVPLGKMSNCMDKINSVLVKKRVKPGDIVVKQLLGRDINLIATDDMTHFDLQRY